MLQNQIIRLVRRSRHPLRRGHQRHDLRKIAILTGQVVGAERICQCNYGLVGLSACALERRWGEKTSPLGLLLGTDSQHGILARRVGANGSHPPCPPWQATCPAMTSGCLCWSPTPSAKVTVCDGSSSCIEPRHRLPRPKLHRRLAGSNPAC
jgi:hypothetical protein